jgi:RHS repeat-associated protein
LAAGDNPTGVAGFYNGDVNTAGSYDPYTGTATRSVTDIGVAGAVGAYPLAFTRTMNSRYTVTADQTQFGPSGSWRHSYQWTVEPVVFQKSDSTKWTAMPTTYTVNYPDGRYLSFSAASGDTHFRGGPGISDRFQQLSGTGGGDCFLILPDGGKVWFQADVDREVVEGTQIVTSTFTFQLMGIYDPYGQLTTVGDLGDGCLTIKEPAGRTLKLYYIQTPWNGDVVIDRVVASDGRTVKYNYGGYQPAGATTYTSLSNVQYLDNNGASYVQAIYAYQPNNVVSNGRPLISWAIDPMYNGPMWAIGYTFVPSFAGGVYGQLQSENYLDPRTGTVGQVVSSLSANGNSRTETRGDGPSRTFNYSGGKLVSYTDFKGQTSSISYDGNGFISAFTDARGKTTSMLRDSLVGALTVLTHPDTEQSTQGYVYWTANDAPYYLQIRGDERGHLTYFTRDQNNFELTRIDYPNGSYETFTYNNFGEVLNHRMPNDGVETRFYDGRGMMWASSNPDGTTYYFYDGNDRLEHVVDPRGKTTWFQYNPRGQKTRVTHVDGTYLQSAYNVDGTVAWTADENHPGADTDASQRTRYAYDDYKRVASVTNPANETTSFVYAQDWSNAYNQTTSNLKGVFSPLNKQVHYAYDENWQRTITRVPPGSDPNDAWTFFGYDAVGNLNWTQDPRGYPTTFGYDNRNRRISMTDALNQTTTWEYDTTSNLTRETRPDQTYRTTAYDTMNRVIDTYGFANEHTHYDRDLSENVYQMIDPKNATYGFGYDLLNRKTSATYPADALGVGRSETWHYDADGNLDLYKNPADQYRHLFYDDRNRMYDAWWDNWAAPEVVIGYDWASRITSIVTNTAQVTAETMIVYGYDNANRRVSEDQTLAGYPTRHIGTPRDVDGNRSQLSVTTNGHLDYEINFEYTQRNQLWHINGGGNASRLTEYSYDASGNLTYRRNDWMLVADDSFSYDQLNRMAEVDTGDASVWFAHTHYQYDNVGREVARWRDEEGSKGERFWFNAANQLTRAVYQADNVWTPNPSNWTGFRDYNHTQDLLNWASVNDNGYLAQLQHSEMNQYTNVNGVQMGFDANFNQTSSYYGYTFVYNAQNQLVSGSIQATYDGLGRCVRRTVGGNTLLFTYDGWNPIMEWDTNGNCPAWTIYGAKPDEVLVRDDATYGALIYKHDNQGSVTFILDGSNRIVEKYTYDVYGRPTVTSWDYNSGTWKTASDRSSFGNRFMFTGREWLADVQLYDYRNRLYNPDTGRFMQSDPLGFDAGDMNFFRYCADDPVNRRDPSGHQSYIPLFPSQDYVNGLTAQYYEEQTAGIGAVNNYISAYNTGLSVVESYQFRGTVGSFEVFSGVEGVMAGVEMYATPAAEVAAPQIQAGLVEIYSGMHNVGEAADGHGFDLGAPLPLMQNPFAATNTLNFYDVGDGTRYVYDSDWTWIGQTVGDSSSNGGNSPSGFNLIVIDVYSDSETGSRIPRRNH